MFLINFRHQIKNLVSNYRHLGLEASANLF